MSYSIENTTPVYKKHPVGLELIRIPSEIRKAYSDLTAYDYIKVESFGEIPFTRFALSGLEEFNIELTADLKESYTKGFIIGFSDNLIPYIDTPENRIERILIEIARKDNTGFSVHVVGPKEHYCQTDEIFECGVFEGSRYKAWSYIFDSPNAYLSLFTTSNEKVNDLSSIFNDTFNGFDICQQILEDVGLTVNRIPCVNKWSGKIIGVIDAIKKTPGLLKNDYTTTTLLSYFNTHLGTAFISYDKRSKAYQAAFDDAKRIIKNNFKK